MKLPLTLSQKKGNHFTYENIKQRENRYIFKMYKITLLTVNKAKNIPNQIF